MATYEYRCDECGEEFSRTERMSQHGHEHPTCPECKSANVAPVLSSFYAKTAHKS